jgi:hypothetical protein
MQVQLVLMYMVQFWKPLKKYKFTHVWNYHIYI